MIEIFLIPEGRSNAYTKEPYKRLRADIAIASRLGLSSGQHHSHEPPEFNVETTDRNLDGFRDPRFAVARLDTTAGKALGLQDGYYLLHRSIETTRKICAEHGNQAS